MVMDKGVFRDLIGKLVKLQRGPATVNGSILQWPTVRKRMGRGSDTMTISQETCLYSYTITYEDREVWMEYESRRVFMGSYLIRTSLQPIVEMFFAF